MEDLAAWYSQQPAQIAGLDEVGRGPLAGSVVAAAVVLNPDYPIAGLRDSKKLTPSKRELFHDKIMQTALAVGVASLDARQIDKTNILKASLEAMAQAFAQVQAHLKGALVGALVDGNQKAPLPALIKQYTVVGGDGIWPCIMAASIVAKVTRDRQMLEAEKLYPGYGFAAHKGYGTQEHLKALRSLGPCPIHRMSYAPVAQLELF